MSIRGRQGSRRRAAKQDAQRTGAAGSYWTAMATRREIRAVADRIAAAFSPERIILFGSHAYGTPTPDSDVDLLIALPFEGRPAAKAIEIRHAAQAPFALDLLAYPPDYIRTRVAMGDSFLKEITERGRVLYESSHV